jgi:hypothetical protein
MRARYILKVRQRFGSQVGNWRSIGTFANYADAEDRARGYEKSGFDVYIGEAYREKPSKSALAFSLKANEPLELKPLPPGATAILEANKKR